MEYEHSGIVEPRRNSVDRSKSRRDDLCRLSFVRVLCRTYLMYSMRLENVVIDQTAVPSERKTDSICDEVHTNDAYRLVEFIQKRNTGVSRSILDESDPHEERYSRINAYRIHIDIQRCVVREFQGSIDYVIVDNHTKGLAEEDSEE